MRTTSLQLVGGVTGIYTVYKYSILEPYAPMPALALASLSPLTDLHADVWHADALAFSPAQVVPTGDAALDAQLPGGGWPVGGLTEILQWEGVHSEWRLLLPALAASGHGAVALVGAPHIPFAPALASQGLLGQRLLWINAQPMPARLWAAEQALRCADVDAVLLWLGPERKGAVRSDQLRRLQMAASEHQKLLFVMRPEAAHSEASPAVLRVRVGPQPDAAAPDAAPPAANALQVQLLKRRGPPLAHGLTLPARAPRMALLLAASQHHALDRTSA